jgi:hypothetical protein
MVVTKIWIEDKLNIVALGQLVVLVLKNPVFRKGDDRAGDLPSGFLRFGWFANEVREPAGIFRLLSWYSYHMESAKDRCANWRNDLIRTSVGFRC